MRRSLFIKFFGAVIGALNVGSVSRASEGVKANQGDFKCDAYHYLIALEKFHIGLHLAVRGPEGCSFKYRGDLARHPYVVRSLPFKGRPAVWVIQSPDGEDTRMTLMLAPPGYDDIAIVVSVDGVRFRCCVIDHDGSKPQLSNDKIVPNTKFTWRTYVTRAALCAEKLDVRAQFCDPEFVLRRFKTTNAKPAEAKTTAKQKKMDK